MFIFAFLLILAAYPYSYDVDSANVPTFVCEHLLNDTISYKFGITSCDGSRITTCCYWLGMSYGKQSIMRAHADAWFCGCLDRIEVPFFKQLLCKPAFKSMCNTVKLEGAPFHWSANDSLQYIEDLEDKKRVQRLLSRSRVTKTLENNNNMVNGRANDIEE